MATFPAGHVLTAGEANLFRSAQAGTTSASFSASATFTGTVTFPSAFPATPFVVCQVQSGSGSAIKATVLVTSVGASSFNIRVDLQAAATITISIHWIAMSGT